MTDNRIELTPPPAMRIWGDQEPLWAPETVGRRAKTAETPWKIDPDPDFPDTVFDSGRVGDVRVMACAARGAKHRYEGTARQDAAMAAYAGDWALAAVADGVGSVPDSHRAATVAVRSCLATLAHRIEFAGANALLSGAAVFKHVSTELERLGGPKTTLTVAAVSAVPDQGGNYEGWVARVGDSPAYVLADGRFLPLFPEERADEFGTGTDALPTGRLRAERSEKRIRLRSGQALALVSDGIGELIGTDDRRAASHEGPIPDDIREYYLNEWRCEPHPVDFIRQTQTRRRTYDDDRSAAVLWPVPGSAPTAPTLRYGGNLRTWNPAVQDVELSAARHGAIEVRTAVTKGAPSDRERRSRIILAASGDRIVVVAAVAVPGAPALVDRWTKALRSFAEGMPPDLPSLDWTALVWHRAQLSLAEEPDFDPAALSTAVLCLEPSGTGVHYTLSVSAGISAAIAERGVSRPIADVREPENTYLDRASGAEWFDYADQLGPEQRLQLTHGIDPAHAAAAERPGPMQTFGLLQGGSDGDDRLIVTAWSEP
jgi:hypothetical protein